MNTETAKKWTVGNPEKTNNPRNPTEQSRERASLQEDMLVENTSSVTLEGFLRDVPIGGRTSSRECQRERRDIHRQDADSNRGPPRRSSTPSTRRRRPRHRPRGGAVACRLRVQPTVARIALLIRVTDGVPEIAGWSFTLTSLRMASSYWTRTSSCARLTSTSSTPSVRAYAFDTLGAERAGHPADVELFVCRSHRGSYLSHDPHNKHYDNGCSAMIHHRSSLKLCGGTLTVGVALLAGTHMALLKS